MPNCVRENGFTTGCRSEQNRFAMSLRDSPTLPFGAVQRRLGRGADVAFICLVAATNAAAETSENPFGSTRDERIQPRTYSNSFSHVISLSARALPRFSRSAGRRAADQTLGRCRTEHRVALDRVRGHGPFGRSPSSVQFPGCSCNDRFSSSRARLQFSFRGMVATARTRKFLKKKRDKQRAFRVQAAANCSHESKTQPQKS